MMDREERRNLCKRLGGLQRGIWRDLIGEAILQIGTSGNRLDELDDANTERLADTLRELPSVKAMGERIAELEDKNLHHTTRTHIANLTDHNISQKADIDRLTKQNKILDDVLGLCRKKLEIYRDNSDGEYHGGIEHTSLIRMVDDVRQAAKEVDCEYSNQGV